MLAKYDGGELEHGIDDSYGGYGLKQDFEQTEVFQLGLGDCLLFGDLCPHRTFVPEGANLSRRSLEFRLMNAARLQSGRDYFSIAENKLIHCP